MFAFLISSPIFLFTLSPFSVRALMVWECYHSFNTQTQSSSGLSMLRSILRLVAGVQQAGAPQRRFSGERASSQRHVCHPRPR
jgi:hypothetical protein